MSNKELIGRINKFAQQNQTTANAVLADSWNGIATALAYKTTQPLNTAKAIQEHLNNIYKILATQSQ